MTATLRKAYGYQDDAMNLPVANVDDALRFYERVLGFRTLTRHEAPHRSAVLGRDEVRIGLVENGGDSSQDGCAFHVDDLDALLSEFRMNGLRKDPSDVGTEQREDGRWRVFYVIAPDGLCYWFGERESS